MSINKCAHIHMYIYVHIHIRVFVYTYIQNACMKAFVDTPYLVPGHGYQPVVLLWGGWRCLKAEASLHVLLRGIAQRNSLQHLQLGPLVSECVG